MVLLVAGGGYGFWQYNRSHYYVGVTKDGFVAVFRGTSQSLAGISMSSLLSRSTLKASMLTSGDQATLAQTISVSSSSDADQRISQLWQEATQCRQTYQSLASWQAASLNFQRYQQQKALAAKTKTKSPAAVANPGPVPAQLPSPSQCAPSTQFGIPAASLPSQTAAAPSAQPTPTTVSPDELSTPASTAPAAPRSSAVSRSPAPATTTANPFGNPFGNGSGNGTAVDNGGGNGGPGGGFGGTGF